MLSESICNTLYSPPITGRGLGEGLLLTILGPTACGKTTFAAHLAVALDGEILSADSRQVYRGMDIGTGKDLCDYRVSVGKRGCCEGTENAFDGEVEYRDIPYHLIDIADAGERYNVFEFQRDFHTAYADIVARGKTPILCGGTGLYIESVIRGYEFENSEKGRAEQSFPPMDSLVIGLDIDRDLRREKITRRLHARLEEGMVDEIRGLINRGVPVERLLRYGLEYKFVTQYIIGELSYDRMVELLEIAIHQFAKRQMTWFRGMEERRGIKIHWLSCATPMDERVEQAVAMWNDYLSRR